MHGRLLGRSLQARVCCWKFGFLNIDGQEKMDFQGMAPVSEGRDHPAA